MRDIGHLVIAIAFLVGGCGDPAEGTATSAKLETMPDLSCIDAALRKEVGPRLGVAHEAGPLAGSSNLFLGIWPRLKCDAGDWEDGGGDTISEHQRSDGQRRDASGKV